MIPGCCREALLIACILIALSGCNNVAMQPGLSNAVRDYTDALPVVPGIEGFGIDTVAGRGGELVRVTNLHAAGEGSLRAALEISGPRVIVFEVSGVIDLREPLVIAQPFVTVAGETAPSPGITVIGAGIIITTHDVLLRHLRFRVGDCLDGPPPDERDGISIYDGHDPGIGAGNVVIDHCSIAWAVDEGMSNWGGHISDITYSRCIIAENLSHSLHSKGEHSKGLLVGDDARRVAIVGNLFAHNKERNPFIKGNVSALVAHNVIYNPGTAAIHVGDRERSGPSIVTVMGNVLIPGPDTRRLLPLVRLQLDMNPNTRVYALDNDSGGRALVRTLWARRCWKPIALYDAAPVRVRPIAKRSPEETLEWVLRTAGARPRERDPVDERIVASVRRGDGRIIDSIDQVGGFPAHEPTFRPLTPPQDPHTRGSDGYTHLEHWLRTFADAVE